MPFSAQAIPAPSRMMMLLELRALHEFGAFLGARPLLRQTAEGDGHPLIVLPGLAASDASTRPLRRFLRERGYAASGWQQGRNNGLTTGVEERMVTLVRGLADKHGRKVSLIGWSLGGLYARQLAKMMPEHVRSVITLGSPFAGNPKSTNAWRLYEATSGQRAGESFDHPAGPMAEPPPVPTTAIFSRTDGVCAWRACMEMPGPLSESIEVRGSHLGMCHHPAVVYTMADRLAQREGEWKPFHRDGWRSLFFPDPTRH